MPRERSWGSRLKVRPWMVTLAAPLVAYGALHLAAREALRQKGWFDSWQYTTRGDHKTGYRLRAGVHNRFGGVPVYVNADGLRVPAPADHVRQKLATELRVVVLGDSNSFGADLAYEQTYSAELERELRERRASAVSVINAGVPGYSLLQTLERLKQLAPLKPDLIVVTVNGANDRLFIGRADSPLAFEHDFSLRRYEFGDFISYPILYWSQRSALENASSAAVPDLSRAPPTARVPLAWYPALLQDLLREARRQGASLLLLSTGESTDSVTIDAGLAALKGHDLRLALSQFEQAQVEQPGLFLPAYHAYQLALELGDPDRARAAARRYRADYAADREHYLKNLVHCSLEYASSVNRFADEFKVSLLDLHEAFLTQHVRFHEGHFDANGHRLVAQALAEAIATLPLFASRQAAAEPAASSDAPKATSRNQ